MSSQARDTATSLLRVRLLCRYFSELRDRIRPMLPHGQSAQSIRKVAASEVFLVAVRFFQQIIRSPNAGENCALRVARLWFVPATSFRTARQARALAPGW